MFPSLEAVAAKILLQAPPPITLFDEPVVSHPAIILQWPPPINELKSEELNILLRQPATIELRLAEAKFCNPHPKKISVPEPVFCRPPPINPQVPLAILQKPPTIDACAALTIFLHPPPTKLPNADA